MKTLISLVYVLILSELPCEINQYYLTVDSASHRLYISRRIHVLVIDTLTDKVIGDIPDTPGVHGITLATELNRGVTTQEKVMCCFSRL